MQRKWVSLLVCCVVLTFVLAVAPRAAGARRAYIINIDAMRGDYLSSKGADGKSLTPNLDKFRQKSVVFANCYDMLPAFTDTNHMAIISSASAGRSGIWGAGGYFGGFDEKGQPMLRMYDFADVQAPTIYDSVKQADPSAKTAVVSAKHWVAEMFANKNPAVDVMAHGRTHPDFVPQPEGYWLGGPTQDPNAVPRIYLRGEDEPPTGLMGMIGMTATDSPSDDWVTDAAIATIQKEDPEFMYVLYADLDTAGHIYGSGNVPADWTEMDNQEAMRDQVRITDAAVGRLLNFLETTGRLRNSVVIITADHGMTSTRDPFRFPAGQSLATVMKNPASILPLLQQGKIGTLAVDVRDILAKKGILDRMAVKKGETPDYDYIFSEASSAYLYGVKQDKEAEIVKILNDWNNAQAEPPMWLILTREEMKNGVNPKTGFPYGLYNVTSAKVVCPETGQCALPNPQDADPASKATHYVPWPDIAVFMNEGKINVVYPEAIIQGAFALMKSAALDKLNIKLNPIPYVPGSHGTSAEQHVPLLVAAPDLPGGTVVDRNVSLLDIFPTISHFIPAWKLPEGVEGKSLF